MKNDNYVMILLFMIGKSESIYCECHQYHKANISLFDPSDADEGRSIWAMIDSHLWQLETSHGRNQWVSRQWLLACLTPVRQRMSHARAQ